MPCTLKSLPLYSPLPGIASYQRGVVGTATDELLSLQEAADRLGVSVYTVRRWIKDGKLRAFKPGKEYRVREPDFEEFLRTREVRPKAPRRSPSEPSFNDVLDQQRRSEQLKHLRAWRAFVWKLEHRWKEEPPQTSREIAVVVDTMQALIDEGAFEQPQDQITASDWRTASEGIEQQALFLGLQRLNEIADDAEQDETAQQRRELLKALPGELSA
jgi:excisionase family DNA binding protein